MKRYAVGAIVLIALLAALTSYPDRSSGQDASEARIAALETQVADLSSDVSSLRKRVKKLEQAGSSGADEKSEGQTLKGTGDTSITARFGAGTYQTSGDCSAGNFYVYVTNDGNGTNEFVVSVDGGGEAFAPLVIVESNDYQVDVHCDGDWSVSFD